MNPSAWVNHLYFYLFLMVSLMRRQMAPMSVKPIMAQVRSMIRSIPTPSTEMTSRPVFWEATMGTYAVYAQWIYYQMFKERKL